MDINTIKNKISEKMKEMPIYLQEAINSSGWEKKIFDIGRKYNLHVDDLDYLQIELSSALVGISDQGDFTENVKTNLGLSDEVVEHIVEDINNQIFSHIREQLKEDVLDKENKSYEEEKNEKDDEIGLKEKEHLKKFGVSLDLEDKDEPQEAVKEALKEEPEEEFIPIPKDEPIKTQDASEKEETKTPNLGVFKSQTKVVLDEKNKNIDPYREPLD